MVAAVTEAMVSVPDRNFVPLHPFDAVHEEVLVEDHVRITLPPETTLAAFALRLRVVVGVRAEAEAFVLGKHA